MQYAHYTSHSYTHTYSNISIVSSTELGVILKIVPSDGWGRVGVIPGWINIEHQPDGGGEPHWYLHSRANTHTQTHTLLLHLHIQYYSVT